MSGKFQKILKVLRGTLRKILKKRKVKFEEISSITNVSRLSSYATPSSPQNSVLLLCLLIASYLSLVYIRATARAIREETIFVDASNGSH